MEMWPDSELMEDEDIGFFGDFSAPKMEDRQPIRLPKPKLEDCKPIRLPKPKLEDCKPIREEKFQTNSTSGHVPAMKVEPAADMKIEFIDPAPTR
jgi:hypothetical protein